MDSERTSIKGDSPDARLSLGEAARRAFAGVVGATVHHAARLMRGSVSATAEPDPGNVAVVCSAFLRYGAAQAIGLRQTGLNVTLYYVDKGSDFTGSEHDTALLLSGARAAGVELVAVPRARPRKLIADIVRLHRDLRRRKISVAVVQSHIDPRYATLGFAQPVALFLHDPKPHTGDTLSAFSLPLRLIARFAELTSACLIVHSTQLLEQIRPLLGAVPVGVVPHGADMAGTPSPVPAERRLLIFGRLFAYKGVDTALAAMSELPVDFSDVRLIVAGRGPLAELARGRPEVELREEYIAESDIPGLLDQVRLVLLPYKDATQSGVGLLAVARGIPCVVSRAGGLPELVEDSSPGLVVAPDDPAQLAEAIVNYIDHEESLRAAIYEHSATHFAWPVVASRLRSELRRLSVGVAGGDPVVTAERG